MASTSRCVCVLFVCVSTHTWNTSPQGMYFFAFFLCSSVLYKQIELEKSSHWNIISTSNLRVFSSQLVMSSLFNQRAQKLKSSDMFRTNWLSKAVPGLDRLPVTRCQQALGLFFFSWALTLAATRCVNWGGEQTLTKWKRKPVLVCLSCERRRWRSSRVRNNVVIPKECHFGFTVVKRDC